MHFLSLNLSVFLMLLVGVNSTNIDINTAMPSFLNVMAMHFNNSMDYLYTSKQFDSQYMERPGMAKFLMQASDFEWEQGIDFLKKYFQRDGTINDFRDSIWFGGQGALTLSETDSQKFIKYSSTFGNLLDDAETTFGAMNTARHQAITSAANYEIAHYLDDKLEKKAERIYELKKYKTIVNQLDGYGVAIHAFDSNL